LNLGAPVGIFLGGARDYYQAGTYAYTYMLQDCLLDGW